MLTRGNTREKEMVVLVETVLNSRFTMAGMLNGMKDQPVPEMKIEINKSLCSLVITTDTPELTCTEKQVGKCEMKNNETS